jgi:hypothetical protein
MTQSTGTGEHLAIPASASPGDGWGRAKIILGVIVAIIAIASIALGAAATWGASSDDLAEHDEAIQSNEEAIDAIKEDVASQRTDIAVIKTEMAGVKRAMEKVDKRTGKTHDAVLRIEGMLPKGQSE